MAVRWSRLDSAARTDAGAGRHAGGLRRLDRLDDLHVVHPLAAASPTTPSIPALVRASTTGCSATPPGRPRSRNLVVLALGSALAIVLGFVLAAMVEREKRGEGFFRTIFLYPLAISLIVTGLVWRWMFNPALGIENFLHQLGWTERRVQLAGRPGDRDVRRSSSPRSGTGSASTWR